MRGAENQTEIKKKKANSGIEQQTSEDGKKPPRWFAC